MKAIIENRTLPDGSALERVGDVAVITGGGGNLLKKVGGLVVAHYGAALYRQVGTIKKFSQLGKSKSLRRDRVAVKRMLRMVA